MRLIVTGGGTGGHIYPAIAIAQKFKAMDENTEVLYVGCHEGFEKDIVPKAGLDIKLVDARWINKSNPYQLVKTGVRVLHGISMSRKVIKEFKPDVIIGTGGYVCFPVIFAGSHLGVKCFLHEQNAFPGLANRKLEKDVEGIFLGFDDARKYFNDQSKITYAGNPVRSTFFTNTKEGAREKLGYRQDEFIVLSFGGSLGSDAMNNVAYDLAKDLSGRENVRMIFGTGKAYYGQVMERFESEKFQPESNIEVKDYIHDMDDVLMASDLVISRAGALSVSETNAAGKASILVPSPNVTGNHQYFNAKAVSDRGGALLIEEKDLNSELIISEVEKLIGDRELLSEMSINSRKCAPDQALNIIYKGVMDKLEKK